MNAEKLTSVPELRELALAVEQATDGRVYFGYATQPASTTYYCFSASIIPKLGAPYYERMTLREATEWLIAVQGWIAGGGLEKNT